MSNNNIFAELLKLQNIDLNSGKNNPCKKFELQYQKVMSNPISFKSFITPVEPNKYLPKSSPLQQRLQIEKEIMALELPQFQLYRNSDDTFFRGSYITAAGGNLYQLKLVLPPYYPDQMPRLFVTYPKILRKYGYTGFINGETISHSFHTLSNGPDGCVQICHHKKATWDASKTAVGVLSKGILWLESYDVHLLNGKDIADILCEFKKRQS